MQRDERGTRVRRDNTVNRPARDRWWPVPVAAGAAAVAFGIVVKIADSVRESDAVVRNDARILDFMVRHRTAFLTHLAKAVTQLGSGWVVAPIVVICVAQLLRSRHRRAALVVVVSSAGAAVLVEIAKRLVGRPRPAIAERLVRAHGLAFPSGHAAQSIACYGAIAFLAWELGATRRTRVLAALTAAALAFAVGGSRVYLGVHWPSDVLSGWLLGAGWLTALIGMSLAIPAHRQ